MLTHSPKQARGGCHPASTGRPRQHNIDNKHTHRRSIGTMTMVEKKSNFYVSSLLFYRHPETYSMKLSWLNINNFTLSRSSSSPFHAALLCRYAIPFRESSGGWAASSEWARPLFTFCMLWDIKNNIISTTKQQLKWKLYAKTPADGVRVRWTLDFSFHFFFLRSLSLHLLFIPPSQSSAENYHGATFKFAFARHRRRCRFLLLPFISQYTF